MSSLTDEIKARIDLVDLIGRTVNLRRSGSSFKGLCPFHQEKTPSFYVFPNSNTFVCFGCQKKGTAFDWLMEREHLEFGEALRVLAKQAGVDVPERGHPDETSYRQRLLDALSKAQLYYQGLLQGTAGTAAKHYLVGRGLNDEVMQRFGLGWAPSGNGLLRYLREQGVADDDMLQAGLVSQGEVGHLFDFLRERVVFPIRDAQGHTIAFGGRAIGDATPKYLNSRDTPLFHKQETLFALDQARKAIGQERRAVVVEGYMDAITAHQHGHRNVVATLGTAVTERHLAQLRRLADEIVLALDSDAAGQAATWRTLQVAEQSLLQGVTPALGADRRQRQYVPSRAARLKVLTVPAAKDPDELIRNEPAAWNALVRDAKSVLDYVLDGLPSRHDLSTARGKGEAAEEVADLLAGIANPVEQAAYVQRAAQTLGVRDDAVWQSVKRHRRSVRPPRPAPEPEPVAAAPASAESLDQDSGDPLDEYVVALVAHLAEHVGLASLGDRLPAADEFVHPQARSLYRQLTASGATVESLKASIDPALGRTLERIERRLQDAARLEETQALRELERARAQMRHRALVQRKTQLASILRDGIEPEEIGRWSSELSSVARALDEVEALLRERPVYVAGRA